MSAICRTCGGEVPSHKPSVLDPEGSTHPGHRISSLQGTSKEELEKISEGILALAKIEMVDGYRVHYIGNIHKEVCEAVDFTVEISGDLYQEAFYHPEKIPDLALRVFMNTAYEDDPGASYCDTQPVDLLEIEHTKVKPRIKSARQFFKDVQ